MLAKLLSMSLISLTDEVIGEIFDDWSRLWSLSGWFIHCDKDGLRRLHNHATIGLIGITFNG
jgi:hypothetical protein